jgi:hypothetical protein
MNSIMDGIASIIVDNMLDKAVHTDVVACNITAAVMEHIF